jgi:hypothetical protein
MNNTGVLDLQPHILSLLYRKESPKHIRIIQHKKKRCVNCRCRFYPKKHILNQRYCSKKTCQRARKNAWLCHKIKYDQDYRDNKKAAQRKWKLLHPDYYRNYKKRTSGSKIGNSDVNSNDMEKINKINFKLPILKFSLAKSVLTSLRKAKNVTCICRLSCPKL